MSTPSSGLSLYWAALKAGVAQISDYDIGLISAGVAFYAVLSLFPALAALIAILSLISDPVVVIAQMEEMRELLPDDVYESIILEEQDQDSTWRHIPADQITYDMP